MPLTSLKLSDYFMAGTFVTSLASFYYVYKTINEDQEDSVEDEEEEYVDSLPSPRLRKVQSKRESLFKKRLMGDLDASFASLDGNDVKEFEDEGKRIFKVCITGGKMSGKRTCTAYLNEKLRDLGMKVFVVPNVTELTRTAGFDVFNSKLSIRDQINAVIYYCKMVMRLENYFNEMANDEEDDSILLCSHGVMEAKAFVPPEIWEGVLAETGWTEMNLRDKRYDMVLHMVTSADGAESDYNDKDKEKAILKDQARRKAWNGHQKLHIVRNIKGQSFQDKIKYAWVLVSSVIGLPVTNKLFKKFLLDTPGDKPIFFPKGMEVEEHTQTEIFLESLNKNLQITLTRRGTHGLNRYMYSCRMPSKQVDERIELMRQISAQEFMDYKVQKNPNTIEVKKRVYCFLHNQCSFKVEQFLNTNRKITILRVESSTDLDLKTDFPDFLTVREEITENSSYHTFFMSLKQQR